MNKDVTDKNLPYIPNEQDMHQMFYTNRIFSKLHTKCEKDLKSAERTTNKCVVHGKVTETNLVKKNSEYLGGKIKGTDKKWNAQKDNFKIC